MKMKETLERALRGQPHRTKSSLTEMLMFPCSAQHMYRNLGREGDRPRSYGSILQPLIEKEHRKTLRKYLKGAFKEEFMSVEDPIKVSDAVEIEVLGLIGDSPVAALYSKTTTDNILPGHVRIVGAYLAGVSENDATILSIDRDSLKMTAWRIRSGNRSMVDAITMDAEYIEGLLLNLTDSVDGVSSECRTCSFKGTCEVAQENKFSAKPFPITAIYHERLLKVEEKIDKYLLSLNEVDDGRNTGYLSPSEMSISSCDRRMWYKMKKVDRKADISPSLRKIFDMGHAIHEVIQSILHEEEEGFSSERTASLAGTAVSGSCDGDLANEGLEIKSISHKGFIKLRSPKTEHKKQGSTYCAALGLDKMLFVYYNKRTGEIATFYEPMDPKLVGKTKARAKRIEQAVMDDEIPERKTGWGCRTCAYEHICKPGV